jgi:hypothetical protein
MAALIEALREDWDAEIDDYDDLHEFSVDRPHEFWLTAKDLLGLEADPWGDVVLAPASIGAGGLALLAASGVMFAFVWRAIVAVRVLVTLIALLFAGYAGLSVAIVLPLGLSVTPEYAGACFLLLGAAIASSPIFLARSSGRAMRFAWVPLASSGALIAIAVMALTFSSWGRPYEEIAVALVMASQFGTAAGFRSLQRLVAVALRDPKVASAEGSA